MHTCFAWNGMSYQHSILVGSHILFTVYPLLLLATRSVQWYVDMLVGRWLVDLMHIQDRRPLTLGDLIEPPPPTELTQAPIPQDEDEDEDIDDLRSGSSAKIDELIHLLQLTPDTENSLVFSQFTSFLDKVRS